MSTVGLIVTLSALALAALGKYIWLQGVSSPLF